MPVFFVCAAYGTTEELTVLARVLPNSELTTADPILGTSQRRAEYPAGLDHGAAGYSIEKASRAGGSIIAERDEDVPQEAFALDAPNGTARKTGLKAGSVKFNQVTQGGGVVFLPRLQFGVDG